VVGRCERNGPELTRSPTPPTTPPTTTPTSTPQVVAAGSARHLEAEAAGLPVAAVEVAQRGLQGAEAHAGALKSLLDLDPAAFALPAFADTVQGTVPLAPAWRLRGEVVRGFGRGSKMLGIPTANLDAEAVRTQLGEATSGVFGGWAGVGDRDEVYMMVMSVGWNPQFENTERTVEPWLLHDFDADFYGEEIRLLTAFYIRPEAKFTTMENLIERIHEDARITKAVLRDAAAPYAGLAAEAFLRPPGSA